MTAAMHFHVQADHKGIIAIVAEYNALLYCPPRPCGLSSS